MQFILELGHEHVTIHHAIHFLFIKSRNFLCYVKRFICMSIFCCLLLRFPSFSLSHWNMEIAFIVPPTCIFLSSRQVLDCMQCMRFFFSPSAYYYHYSWWNTKTSQKPKGDSRTSCDKQFSKTSWQLTTFHYIVLCTIVCKASNSNNEEWRMKTEDEERNAILLRW